MPSDTYLSSRHYFRLSTMPLLMAAHPRPGKRARSDHLYPSRITRGTWQRAKALTCPPKSQDPISVEHSLDTMEKKMNRTCQPVWHWQQTLTEGQYLLIGSFLFLSDSALLWIFYCFSTVENFVQKNTTELWEILKISSAVISSVHTLLSDRFRGAPILTVCVWWGDFKLFSMERLGNLWKIRSSGWEKHSF